MRKVSNNYFALIKDKKDKIIDLENGNQILNFDFQKKLEICKVDSRTHQNTELPIFISKSTDSVYDHLNQFTILDIFTKNYTTNSKFYYAFVNASTYSIANPTLIHLEKSDESTKNLKVFNYEKDQFFVLHRNELGFFFYTIKEEKVIKKYFKVHNSNIVEYQAVSASQVVSIDASNILKFWTVEDNQLKILFSKKIIYPMFLNTLKILPNF